MFLIGIMSVTAIIYGLMRSVYTGRYKNLALWLWAAPLTGMVYFSQTDIVNGLVVIIGIIMMLVTLYALSGYAMWSRGGKHRFMKTFIFIVSFVISLYFYYQCCYNGYMDYFVPRRPNIFAVAAAAAAAALIMNSIFITAIDKYFSQKREFVIIKCLAEKKKRPFAVCAINGIKNGVFYRLYCEKLYFYLLKSEKSLKLEAKEGVLGGIYVIKGNVFCQRERKKKRIKKFLRGRMLFVLLAFALVILLFFRLKMRMNFETIIITLMRAVSGRKM